MKRKRSVGGETKHGEGGREDRNDGEEEGRRNKGGKEEEGKRK